MGILRVLSRQGDDRVAWDVERVAVGDPEATAAVNEAERIFREQQARVLLRADSRARQPPGLDDQVRSVGQADPDDSSRCGGIV